MFQLPDKKEPIPLQCIRLGVYALLFTPLVFWKPLDFFFDSTKVFFLMGISEVVLVCFLWLVACSPQWRPKMTRVGLAFCAYLTVLVLATVLGVDPFFSFWASTVRITGVLVWLHLGIIFFVASTVFKTQDDWRKIFFIQSIVGVTVSLFYFLTLISPDQFAYTLGGATLGNSTFFGTYLIFAAFSSSMTTCTATSRNRRLFGTFTTVFFLLILFSTTAQAAALAMIGGLILAVALWCIAIKPFRTAKRIGFSLLAGLVLLFVVSAFQVFQPGSYFNEWFIERSSGGRLAVWSVAWEAFQERPILGWGPENFPIAFFAHYDSCFGSLECGGEYWFDRAHNKILDTLVEMGIVGLVAYLVLFVTALWSIWRAYHKKGLNAWVPILVFTFLAVYFVQNLAEFDVTITSFLFVLVLAYVSTQEDRSDGRLAILHGAGGVRGILASVATLALPFTLFHTVIYPIMTNRTDLVATATTTTQRLAAYEVNSGGSPIGVDYRRIVLAGETAKWILRMSEEERGRFAEPIKQELTLGIQALEDTVNRSPNDLRGSNMLGLLFQLKARYFEPTEFQKAERVLERSLALNPKNQQAYAPLAAVYLDQGKVDEALILLQQAIDLYPSNPQTSLRMLVAVKLGRSAEEYQAKKEEILDLFPQLQDKIELISQLKIESLEQLYAVFY
ncbi:O-antigen ligase family protein [Candidatus Uhrbacteria bacterium]|nr:O-antigen ligase family protein [Candidatus Uhrbacteria bacterium]